jgi:hypothetical protein
MWAHAYLCMCECVVGAYTYRSMLYAVLLLTCSMPPSAILSTSCTLECACLSPLSPSGTSLDQWCFMCLRCFFLCFLDDCRHTSIDHVRVYIYVDCKIVYWAQVILLCAASNNIFNNVYKINILNPLITFYHCIRQKQTWLFRTVINIMCIAAMHCHYIHGLYYFGMYVRVHKPDI